MTEGSQPAQPEQFRAAVVDYDDAPDECTIYPRTVSEDQRTTAWITAREGSFCSLPAMR